MLASTGIIQHVETCFAIISKWNPTPFRFPFTVQKSPGPLNNFRSWDNSNSYKFENNMQNLSSHWIWHTLFLSTTIAMSIYQILFEDVLLEAFVTHLTETFCFIWAIVYAYKQHSQAYLHFLNELLEFENRQEIFLQLKQDKKYWARNIHCRFVKFLIQVFGIMMPVLQVVFAASVAIHPYVPWKFLPDLVLEKFGILNFGGKSGMLFEEMARRIIGFLHAYVTLNLSTNRYLLVIVISVFSGQGSLLLMVQAFEKLATKHSRHVHGKMKVIVIMNREIRIICGVYNEMHKLIVTPSLIVTFVISIAVPMFMLVSKSVVKDLQNVLLFGFIEVIGVTFILLAFQLAVNLYVESNKLFVGKGSQRHDEMTGHLQSNKERHLIKRYSRSFPVLKIFFFESNYFEGNTTLNILTFAINCSIQLILCEK